MEGLCEYPTAEEARAAAATLVERGIGATVDAESRPNLITGQPTVVHVVACLPDDAPRARVLLGLAQPDAEQAAAAQAEEEGVELQAPKLKVPVVRILVVWIVATAVLCLAAFWLSYKLVLR